MKTSSFAGALLLVCIVLPVHLRSQIATTSLRGVLSDQSGALVSGASLALVRPDTGFSITTKSSSARSQRLPNFFLFPVEARNTALTIRLDYCLRIRPITVGNGQAAGIPLVRPWTG